ncbi:hypothetical protein D3C78_1599920 [compost metagenome]
MDGYEDGGGQGDDQCERRGGIGWSFPIGGLADLYVWCQRVGGDPREGDAGG